MTTRPVRSRPRIPEFPNPRVSRPGFPPPRLTAFGRSWSALPFLFLLFLLNTPIAQAEDAERVCARNKETPVLSEPRRDAAVLYKAPASMAFLVTERKGAWLGVRDVDGRTGWLHQDQVRLHLSCVTVDAEDVNVRWGPSEYAKVMFKTDRYASFNVVERRGDWVGVRYYGMTVWVHGSLLWPKP